MQKYQVNTVAAECSRCRWIGYGMERSTAADLGDDEDAMLLKRDWMVMNIGVGMDWIPAIFQFGAPGLDPSQPEPRGGL